jgi:MoaA/NifB/PqqE/SkfB family radical SAM enzyme
LGVFSSEVEFARNRERFMNLEIISIEVTNRCDKACWFCYNHSGPSGATSWAVDDLVSFVSDCAENGVKAVSFGGGEPLQFDGIFDVLGELRGRLFRSMTTNGLHLDDERIERLVECGIDKVHISIHFPDREDEVRRAIGQASALAARGIKSGINLLVPRTHLEAARAAARLIDESGIDRRRVVFLPMRGQHTPTPREMGQVAGGKNFQSMSCLTGCAASPRFASIGWDQTAAWCSYTSARRKMPELSYRGLVTALEGLGLTFCGGMD